jgi:hypothetical protein
MACRWRLRGEGNGVNVYRHGVRQQEGGMPAVLGICRSEAAMHDSFSLQYVVA